MHNFDAPSGTTFHHNGDFSGDVTFIAKILETEDYDSDTGVISVSFDDLKALVAKHVRDAKIYAIEIGDHYSIEAVVALETATDDEVLGL
jgi:hypothetical protein